MDRQSIQSTGQVFLGTPIGADSSISGEPADAVGGAVDVQDGHEAAADPEGTATPGIMGEDYEQSAPIYLGNDNYRTDKLCEMIDAHDARLRAVVQLAQRDSASHAPIARISVQLSHLILRWMDSVAPLGATKYTGQHCVAPLGATK